MLYDVCILSEENSFSRMLFLEAEDCGKSVILSSDPDHLPRASLYLVDADRFDVIPAHADVVRYGRSLLDRTLSPGEEKGFSIAAREEAIELDPWASPSDGDSLGVNTEGSDATHFFKIVEWRRPFSIKALLSLFAGEVRLRRGLFFLPREEHSVLLDGMRIPLVEREYDILACLAEAEGAPVSREEIFRRVWQAEEGNVAIVNVYLHYLRKKLERSGRRILYSIRGHGYALRQEDTV